MMYRKGKHFEYLRRKRPDSEEGKNEKMQRPKTRRRHVRSMKEEKLPSTEGGRPLLKRLLLWEGKGARLKKLETKVEESGKQLDGSREKKRGYFS